MRADVDGRHHRCAAVANRYGDRTESDLQFLVEQGGNPEYVRRVAATIVASAAAEAGPYLRCTVSWIASADQAGSRRARLTPPRTRGAGDAPRRRVAASPL